MRRKSQVDVGALDGSHRAGFAIWQAALGVAVAIPLGHRVGEEAQHLRLGRQRRLRKEHEFHAATSEAMIRATMIGVMLRRLASGFF